MLHRATSSACWARWGNRGSTKRSQPRSEGSGFAQASPGALLPAAKIPPSHTAPADARGRGGQEQLLAAAPRRVCFACPWTLLWRGTRGGSGADPTADP